MWEIHAVWRKIEAAAFGGVTGVLVGAAGTTLRDGGRFTPRKAAPASALLGLVFAVGGVLRTR